MSELESKAILHDKMTQIGSHKNTGAHHVVVINEGIIDGNDFNVLVLEGCAKDDATNATKSTSKCTVNMMKLELKLLEKNKISETRDAMTENEYAHGEE